MSGFTYATLTQAILDYTEVDSTVLTSTITNQFIENSEFKILREVPIDAYKKQQLGNFVTGQDTINVPAKTLFVKGVQVYDSTSAATGNNRWLEKRDESYLQEYVPSTESSARGQPKYYAMFGGATGVSDTTSGRLLLAPAPDTTYKFKIHYETIPDGLSSSNTTTYISQYFPNGLLYACLVEAYGFLKGPTDMLTLYENKYKQEVQKFAAEQLGRRKRDDYTDGTVRIPVPSPSP
jgi:hypothetical protein|tara:strand:- start:235 stop:942 length:708 start_codon:yes stop_codon:yes gene_type:complete